MAPRHRLDAAGVLRAARLAHIALSSAEPERFAKELAPVLDAFERMGSSGASPELASRDRHPEAVLRPDVPDSDPLHVRPSEIAPDWRDGFFVIPRLPALDP